MEDPMTDTHHRTLEACCNALAHLQVHFAEAIHGEASELRLNIGTATMDNIDEHFGIGAIEKAAVKALDEEADEVRARWSTAYESE